MFKPGLDAPVISFLFAVSQVALTALAQSPPVAPSPIQVFASATAKDGKPVTPDASTLSVLIDKQPAQVVSVRPAKDDKLLFAVMVDMSSSEKPKEDALKDAALRIFQGLTNEQSQGYLVFFDVKAYPSKRPLQPNEVQATLDRIRFKGGTALYDSIAQVTSGILSESQNPNARRRVLIVLSDGDDNYSHILPEKMEEAAEREAVPIYSLLEYPLMGQDRGLNVLKQIAKDTGGAVVLANKLTDGVAPLVAAVQNQVLLSIASTRPSDGKLHSFAVKASEKGITIAAPAHILIP